MSSEERDMILQMLAEGKLTAREAADLLDALEPAGDAGTTTDRGGNRWQADQSEGFGYSSTGEARGPSGVRPRPSYAGRSLLIHVSDGDETKTHVTVPLGMAMTAGKFVPRKAQEYFDRYGIDLPSLLDGIANGANNGELVNVKEGTTHVQIVVT